MKFKYETKNRTQTLRDLRKHILQCHSDDSRSTVRSIVVGHGFKAHVGGHHVAVLDDNGERLALITSDKSPDFN